MAVIWVEDTEIEMTKTYTHYRLHIAIIHVKGDTKEEQPELRSVSLPGIRSESRIVTLYANVVLIAQVLMGQRLSYRDFRTYEQEKETDLG